MECHKHAQALVAVVRGVIAASAHKQDPYFLYWVLYPQKLVLFHSTILNVLANKNYMESLLLPLLYVKFA